MATNDRAILTQGQLSTLISSVKDAGREIKTLTAKDYNYPEENPSKFATWLLDAGIYKIQEDVDVIFTTSISNLSVTLTSGQYFIILKSDDYTTAICSLKGELKSITTDSRGSFYTVSGRDLSRGTVLTKDNIINNLTSGYSSYPLSANQGRILNEKISTKQNILTAGTNIIISDDTISADIDALSNQDWDTLFDTSIETVNNQGI